MTIHTHDQSQRQNHSDVIDAASAQRPNGDTMAVRLPEVVRTLRTAGVVRVVTTYAGALCAMAFLNKEAETIHPPCSPAMVREIVQVFESLVIKRAQPKGACQEMRGTIEWDLQQDSLTHEHTAIYRGL